MCVCVCVFVCVCALLTLWGAQVALVDGAGVIGSHPHGPLVALDLRKPLRELHLLGVLHFHPVP